MNKSIILTATFLGSVSINVKATSCWELIGLQEDARERATRLSDVVIIGIVKGQYLTTVETENVRGLYKTKTIVDVERVEKGDFQPGVRLSIVGGGGGRLCSCAYEFEVGESYRMYSWKDSDSGQLELGLCSVIERMKQ